MAVQADSLFRKFDGFLRSIEGTRRRMEAAPPGSARRKDIETVYEGLFLATVARFEVFLENLFFGLLVRRISGKSCGASPRISVSNDNVARSIVLRDKKYLDWLPYGRTEQLAKDFLHSGRPFTLLDGIDKGTLTSLLIVRNAIAHQSRHARREFKVKVLGNAPLPPRERTPAGFLRSQFRISPPQTRLELYVQQVRRVAYKITH